MGEFVRLEPHVIEEIVAICDTTLQSLKDARIVADRLTHTEGFGEFDSAKQLAAGYARKAAGTPESAQERVEQFIEAFTQLRDAFASGGEAFLDAEFEWARQLRNIDVDT
ncbi:hypothetical protein CEJ39_13720 [Rhodococcus pyridinivorans]|uniref:hypothetical protein n=1 Tax=Rhodococcus pyridinivorans TaxID=103816 RepID=UPI000DCAA7DC|nr:hypothetical protein [Rhodococcus pyridinivorans]AWZ26984.1 hypothetical protein CEJ39_13720 [Rhodococcus pyridinivorans]MCD5418074.1 hypothetical protein [Rhodococcus pyridinivorans]